jgi:hypothetical protein
LVEWVNGWWDDRPARNERENVEKMQGVPGTIGDERWLNHGGRENKDLFAAASAVEGL